MPLFIATKNKGKLKEFKDMLSPCQIDVKSLYDLDQDLDIQETGQTFYDNALIKAQKLYNHTKQPALADDSGLEVQALHGEPGVYSARYAAGSHENQDLANCQKLLQNLAGMPDHERQAQFVCSLVFIDHKGTPHHFSGTCPGFIGHQLIGSNGFGYDPLFLLPDRTKTMAQLEPQEKHSISHRGQAVKKFFSFFTQYLNELEIKI